VQTFPEDAFCVACRLVLVVYKIRDKSQAIDREELVKQLLTTKPFLRGITVSSWMVFAIYIIANEFPI
jgi:hypothetical protein